jgi:predicted small lipoprotein YifL
MSPTPERAMAARGIVSPVRRGHCPRRKPMEMKAMRNVLLASMAALALSLTACEKKGPAEQAGEAIDESAEKMGDKMEKAMDDAGDEVEEKTDH